LGKKDDKHFAPPEIFFRLPLAGLSWLRPWSCYQKV